MAPYERWQDAAAELRDYLKPATDLQRKLGQFAGIAIGRRTPSLVAAELVKAALIEPLCLATRRPVSARQYEYLCDLANECGIKAPARPRVSEVAGAWIRWFLGNRALIHLRRVRPAPGDIVRVAGKKADASLVSSISRDGRVNLQGLDGGAYPHLLKVLARATSVDATSIALRERVTRRLREEARISPNFADRHINHLEPYLVKAERSENSAQDLFYAIQTSTDERGPQKVIEENPTLLADVVNASLGMWVIPQKRLGAEFVTDFMLAYRDSGGMHWVAVELESPTAAPLLKDGRPGKELRTAEQQIYSWRRWIEDNRDYAHRPPSEGGLGLTYIRPSVPGLIIIGRQNQQTTEYSAVYDRLMPENRIAIHSYDWLVREAKTLRGAACFSWLERD